MRFQACTIITRSYLAQARVLYRSFRQFHPDTRFTALVFDARRGAVDEPFDVLVLDDIGLPPGEETRMPMLYDVTELATALKPWFFAIFLAESRPSCFTLIPILKFFRRSIGLNGSGFWFAYLPRHNCYGSNLCSGTAKEYRQLRQPTESNNQLTCQLFKQHIEIAQGALAIVAPGFCQ
jgi:hypothetical protein